MLLVTLSYLWWLMVGWWKVKWELDVVSGSMDVWGEMTQEMISLSLGVLHTSVIVKYDCIMLFSRALIQYPAAPWAMQMSLLKRINSLQCLLDGDGFVISKFLSPVWCIWEWFLRASWASGGLNTKMSPFSEKTRSPSQVDYFNQ